MMPVEGVETSLGLFSSGVGSRAAWGSSRLGAFREMGETPPASGREGGIAKGESTMRGVKGVEDREITSEDSLSELLNPGEMVPPWFAWRQGSCSGDGVATARACSPCIRVNRVEVDVPRGEGATVRMGGGTRRGLEDEPNDIML
eukprot:GAFH01001940.1.p2 GENE.GAFH01001940.1~~GAFH01001940.1.p2  ORF type:complete len:145 (-),score=7.52 GAFH01001940.1:744-1178(-)